MNKNKRAFTLIELIVTIAVLGILVLVGSPKLIGYLEKAELTRIQHDVKVMEQEIDIALMGSESKFASWDDNGKDLGKLILSDKLYDREGFAKKVEKSHLARHYESQQSELGTGGELYPVSAMAEHSEVDLKTSLGYKIIPAEYSSKINTELEGTFYANPDGKVYYEHGKTLASQKDELIKACEAPVAEDLGYTFEVINGKGTITKYDHREQHIVIPTEFKIEVDGEEICEPVRVIGKAAFAYGPLKKLKLESVVIPGSVEIIEEDAFKDNNIPKITIPSSVKVVKDNILVGNNVSHIIIRGESGSSPIKEINYPGVNIEYNYGTPKDLDIIFDYNSGTIIDYSGTGGKYIEVPKFVTQNGINYPVKGIAKGAYQGLGLISVILPETLERIEDYAFSGNQLTGITIPNSVVHIGNYAFSFNEKTHSHSGEKIATMKTVIMNGIERFNKIDKSGNLLESLGGLKVNLLDGKLVLLDHIFVTSIGNKVEFIDDEESLPGEPEGPVDGQDGPIVFYGLGPEAYDVNDETYVDNIASKTLTWDGDLDNKEIEISYRISFKSGYIDFIFRDKDNKILKSPTSSTNSIRLNYSSSLSEINRKQKMIVPKGTTKIEIYSNSASNRINEINGPKVLSSTPTQHVTSSSTRSEITLNWDKNQRAIIIKNGVRLGEVTGNTFTDKPLHPNSTHNYQVLFLDEHGNGADDYVTISESTKNLDIVFKGLGPEAYDGNDETYVDNIASKTLTWDGDLDNKEIEVSYLINYKSGFIDFIFRDKDNKILKSPSSSTNSIRLNYSSSLSEINRKQKMIVPKGTTKIEIYSNSTTNRINEINGPKVLSSSPTQHVTSSSTRSEITLNWDKNQRAIIIKNDVRLGEVTGNTFTDKPLQPNSTHNYQVLFLDEHGNGADDYVTISESTKNLDIVFKGLGPEAWDGNIETYVDNIASKTLTWDGDLDNKEIEVNYLINYKSGFIDFIFRDKDNKILKSPISSTNSIRLNYSSSLSEINRKQKMIVPKGATKIEIYSNSSTNRINEINGPKVLSSSPTQHITSSSTRSEITLNWDKNQRAIIIKNDVRLGEVTGNTFTDKPLHPNSTHNYQVLFLDENGNGADDYVVISESTKNLDIVFKGLDPEAWDENVETYVDNIGSKTLTWDGDLDNKEIEISYRISFKSGYIDFIFRDKDNKILKSPTSSTNSIRLNYSSSLSEINRKQKMIVPKGATKIEIYSNSSTNRINEINGPKVLSSSPTQHITSSSTRSEITLNWDKNQRAIIIKNGVKLGEVTGNTFTDKPLHPNSTHNYQVLFLDENGNGADDYVTISESTKNLDIVFKGLDPEAWDGNDETYVDNIVSKTLTWDGDLDNKEIEVSYRINFKSGYIDFIFRDKDNKILKSPSSSTNSIRLNYSSSLSEINRKQKMIVPEGTTKIEIYSNSATNRINEINGPIN